MLILWAKAITLAFAIFHVMHNGIKNGQDIKVMIWSCYLQEAFMESPRTLLTVSTIMEYKTSNETLTDKTV